MNNDQQKISDGIILVEKQAITSYSSDLVRRGLELANQILLDDYKYLELNDSRVATTTQSETVQSSQTDDLSSDRNVDYTRLRDLLRAGNWKDADYETYLVMLKVVGRKVDDWIRDEELLNFPCTDLRTIDNLWVKYSDGRFGFSVQKKIYLEFGGKADGRLHMKACSFETFEKFGYCVGWCFDKEDEAGTTGVIWKVSASYDITAPEGHLPFFSYFPFWRFGETPPPFFPPKEVSSLASRLVKCSM